MNRPDEDEDKFDRADAQVFYGYWRDAMARIEELEALIAAGPIPDKEVTMFGLTRYFWGKMFWLGLFLLALAIWGNP